jgi:UDP-hydrolysing UDP-N-acetyl-D-glucosamine 2-epimerase
MGEEPWRVHVVGSPGLDHLRRQTLLEGAALEQALGAPLGRHNLLVTFHPVTLAEDEGRGEFAELLAALDTLGEDTVIWFTRPNADTGSHALNALLDRWAADRSSRVRVHTSLGQLRYLSLMAQVDAVVGNSSSGLYEAPSFHVTTVNVGDRQKGRLAASSVIHCAPAREAIIQALARAQALDTQDTVNPYGDGRSAPRIVALLRELPTRARLLHKSFCTMAGAA